MDIDRQYNDEYKKWLNDLKLRIRNSQIKASVHVNTAMIELYWSIGADIVEKQAEAIWGSSIIRKLSMDLRNEFPHLKGFSETNLRYTKRFYLFYNQSYTIQHQLGAISHQANSREKGKQKEVARGCLINPTASSIRTLKVKQKSKKSADRLNRMIMPMPFANYILLLIPLRKIVLCTCCRC